MPPSRPPLIAPSLSTITSSRIPIHHPNFDKCDVAPCQFPPHALFASSRLPFPSTCHYSQQTHATSKKRIRAVTTRQMQRVMMKADRILDMDTGAPELSAPALSNCGSVFSITRFVEREREDLARYSIIIRELSTIGFAKGATLRQTKCFPTVLVWW
ncbi:hypothetical protein K458DRAFT_199009 [Lentithecium fluviatile CBS 122367]|uniref:Uncharacterized protein n=1 Tax=Lentithecium fluviatile CBS 122367 TaxID=1168545 RepID=A0A6G1J8R0_9PLEO|nr:hypothetical protein K458DRAFT_199009 [Lentithecium fluviatile CBS 122367]